MHTLFHEVHVHVFPIISSTMHTARRRRVRGFRSALGAALLLVTTASAGHAQTGGVSPGDRVRLRAPEAVSGRLTGTVLSATRDTFTVSDGGRVRAVPVGAITQLERSSGRSSGAGARKGLLWGTGIGLGLALLNTGFSDPGCADGTDDCVNTAAGFAVWTGLGAAVGVVVGAARGSERWERVPIGVAVLQGRTPALTISLSF
jgi:hypothetical protein